MEIQKSDSFLERVLEKASQNAVLVRSKYMNLIKRRISSSNNKEAVMNLKCSCSEYDMNVLVTDSDVERVYDRFVKKCPNCGDNVKITFKFK
jgi:acetyl-CoA carboxylase beta subunit